MFFMPYNQLEIYDISRELLIYNKEVLVKNTYDYNSF